MQTLQFVKRIKFSTLWGYVAILGHFSDFSVGWKMGFAEILSKGCQCNKKVAAIAC